jgi:hypothetical protein
VIGAVGALAAQQCMHSDMYRKHNSHVSMEVKGHCPMLSRHYVCAWPAHDAALLAAVTHSGRHDGSIQSDLIVRAVAALIVSRRGTHCVTPRNALCHAEERIVRTSCYSLQPCVSSLHFTLKRSTVLL